MRATLYIIVGVTAISIGDVAVKSFSHSYSVSQLMFMRGIGALLILIPFLYRNAGFSFLKSKRWGALAFRTALLFAGNAIYFSGLSVLPLSEAITLVFIYPLLITALGSLILSEHVGLVRWGAIIIGLLSTILIAQPFGAQANLAYLLPLSSAIFYALFTISTRILGQTESAETMAFTTLLGSALLAALMGLIFGSGFADPQAQGPTSFLFRAWVWPSLVHLPVLCVIFGCAAIIAICMSAAYRIGETSFLAPFEYVVFPLSLLWSYVFWRDTPNQLALIGMTLILFTGLVMAWRSFKAEQKNQKLMSRPILRAYR